MIAELDSVVLNVDMPGQGLAPGDIGVVVLVYRDDAEYEVEFSTLDGETVAVVTLTANQVPSPMAKSPTPVRWLSGGGVLGQILPVIGAHTKGVPKEKCINVWCCKR